MPTLWIRLQFGLFGLLLGCAGVPIYIHLPRFASADLGLSLSIVAVILIGIRIFDFVQDPFIGRILDREPEHLRLAAFFATAGMAVGFLMVFLFPNEAAPGIWLTAGLVILLTSYSLGTILLYGASRGFSGDALWGIAIFRETGTVAGIIVGSMAPLVLAIFVGTEGRYNAFGAFVAILSIFVFFASPVVGRIGAIAKDIQLKLRLSRGILRLLALALVNSLPVAITSTLFLFFVEDALDAANLGGVYLAVFFLSAGICVPLWTRLSKRIGAKDTLTIAMVLAVLGFAGASLLTPSTAAIFWFVCVATGAAVGADMIILPVLFSRVLAREQQPAGQAFGLWFLTSKISLAGAAILALPILDIFGFQPGVSNEAQGLSALIILYAVVPCALKVAAIVMIRTLPKEAFSI
jgi:GPH family glycoside/pentoside/hexuronide:cation symporter